MATVITIPRDSSLQFRLVVGINPLSGALEMVNWIPSTMVNRIPMVMVNKIPIRMVNRIPILEELLYSFRKLIQERGNEKEKNVPKNTSF